MCELLYKLVVTKCLLRLYNDICVGDLMGLVFRKRLVNKVLNKMEIDYGSVVWSQLVDKIHSRMLHNGDNMIDLIKFDHMSYKCQKKFELGRFCRISKWYLHKLSRRYVSIILFSLLSLPHLQVDLLISQVHGWGFNYISVCYVLRKLV